MTKIYENKEYCEEMLECACILCTIIFCLFFFNNLPFSLLCNKLRNETSTALVQVALLTKNDLQEKVNLRTSDSDPEVVQKYVRY